MRHSDIREMLAIYRDLSGADRARVDEHIQNCPECADAMRSFQNIQRDLLNLRLPAPSANARGRFYQAIEGNMRKDNVNDGRISFGSMTRFMGQLASAAVVLLVVAAIWAVFQILNNPSMIAGNATPAPTSTSAIQHVPPTRTPTPVLAAMPTLDPVTPDTDWKTYTDPDFHFSFQYPSNWQVETPKGPRSPNAPEGMDITIRNYTEVETKGDKTTDQLKIEVSLSPMPSTTLEDWFAEQKGQAVSGSGITYMPEEHIIVNGVPAIRWMVKAPMVPQGNQLVALNKGIWHYQLSAYPATSKYISVFDRVVNSLEIP